LTIYSSNRQYSIFNIQYTIYNPNDSHLSKIKDYNINNGERFETYAIEEPAGSGTIALKGAAARKGARGDLIIIICYTTIDDKNLGDFKPAIVLVDKNNKLSSVSLRNWSSGQVVD